MRRRVHEYPRIAFSAIIVISLFSLCTYIAKEDEEFASPSIQNQWRSRQLAELKESSEINNSDSPNTTFSNSRNTTVNPQTCIPAAIEQFPRPLMTQKTRKEGGLIIHLLVSLYTFLALAIACDEYFVPALEKICCAMSLSSDVAGATLMAAGSSAPELAASVIGIFLSKDDIGLGTVVGSAVFNITFVISICGLMSGLVISLHWWPLLRDSLFYLISLIILVLSIKDGYINWYESLIMVVAYFVYIGIMIFNEQLSKNAQNFLSKRGFCLNKDEDVEYTPMDQDSHDKLLETKATEKKVQPEKKGLIEYILNFLSFPLIKIYSITIPDCRESKWANWYMLTLLMSIVWISIFSYVLVWMITIIGSTLHIDDSVMGLTFLAAGVSLPDALSSLAVAKMGLGDMAVSNAVGSNIFDILICLGLPWFLQTVVVSGGTPVPVYNTGMLYSTLCLFATVIFLIALTHFNGWKLDKKYGVILMIWYFIFTLITCLNEFNVFGGTTRPSCPTDY